MNIQIRLELTDDFAKTENLTREAFWNIYRPGCVEHLVLHNIRKDHTFVENLAFVAEGEGKIVGNIIYSKASVIDVNNNKYEVLCMGPFSVLPDYQSKGIGGKLLNHSIKHASQMGFKGVIIFGNPDYYKRFGFKPASDYNITTEDGHNFDAFMALELQKGSLKGITGKFYASSAFKIDDKELESFEKKFPHKEKQITDTQF